MHHQNTDPLSTPERLVLIQTLNGLPKTQFDELVTALNPPPGIIPPNNAPQGDRTSALMSWVEGPTGPKLPELQLTLHQILHPREEAFPELQARVYQSNCVEDPSQSKQNPNAKRLVSPLFLSLGVVTLLIIIRLLGALQSFELAIYDFLMRLPPYDIVDDRIAIVGVQRSELEEVYPEDTPTEIPDSKVKEILEFLLTLSKTEESKIIGLDIFRDEAEPEPKNSSNQKNYYYEDLRNLVDAEKNSIFLTCRRDIRDDLSGFRPISKEAPFGFNDLIVDGRRENLAVIRRYFLTNESYSNKDCRAEESFGYKIALRFLKENKYLTEIQETNWKDQLVNGYGRISIKDTTLEPVWPRTGGFQRISADPYQILLNYRNTGLGQSHTFNRVNATDIFNCPQEPLGCSLDDQDRRFLENASIILIGYVGEKSKDEHLTPLGRLHGVEIHAHTISYILSTVIPDEYAIPRLRVLLVFAEILCILLVGLSGFVVAWVACDSSRLPLLTPKIVIVIIIPGTITLLFVGSWTAFSLGLWLPFLPLSLGFIFSALGVCLVKTRQPKKTSR